MPVPRSMQFAVFSIPAAILLFVLGGLLEKPVVPSRKRVDIAANGERVLRPKTEAEAQADRLRVQRSNQPARACSTAGVVLVGLALFSASWGAVSIIRGKTLHHERRD